MWRCVYRLFLKGGSSDTPMNFILSIRQIVSNLFRSRREPDGDASLYTWWGGGRRADRKSDIKVSLRFGILGVVLAVAISSSMHQSVMQEGYDQVVSRASSEAGLIVEITRGFVRTYSAYQVRFADGKLPNPAIFRAAALARVEAGGHEGGLFQTSVVGLPGREIAQVAEDSFMRQQLLDLKSSPSTPYLSSVFAVDGKTSHRSIWAFKASEQACADCHNRLQNFKGDNRWEKGDLMGAQVVEQNIDPQLNNVNRTAFIQCALTFTAVFAAWLCGMYLINHFRLTRQLKLLASVDPMTGCINRRELYERVEKMEKRLSGALLMLDLDKFKQINDSYGHDVGDEVIKDFAHRLKNLVRSDDWVARVGGEEFVVWLPGIKRMDAIKLAERLRTDIEKAQVVQGDLVVQYTVSIGLRIVEDDISELFDTWMKAADNMLYKAKTEGRNRVVCEC